MKKSLTDAFLRALKKPESGRLEYADLSCRGLEFRITSAGNRSWSYRYRAPRTGKLSRVTIGPYPDIGLGDARLKADEFRRVVADGGHPSEIKRRERLEAPGRRFEVLANRYMQEFARRPYGKRKGPKKSADQDQRNLDLHILPAPAPTGKWRDRDYADIRRRDVIELIEKIIADGKPVLANRIQSLLSSIFSFAVDSDLVDANPCARLKKRGEERAATRVLSDPEIRLFWSEIAKPPLQPATGRALMLELLTGVRPNEVAGMMRSELKDVDGDDAIWTIPGTRTKNGKTHMVPLPPGAITIVRVQLASIDIRERRGMNDCPVFPSRRELNKAVTPHALARAMSRFAEDMKSDAAAVRTWKSEPPTPHDLRRTFRTRLPEIGIPEDIRDRLMNHIPTDVGTKHYDQYSYLKEKREALATWDERLRSIISGDAGGTI